MSVLGDILCLSTVGQGAVFTGINDAEGGDLRYGKPSIEIRIGSSTLDDATILKLTWAEARILARYLLHIVDIAEHG